MKIDAPRDGAAREAAIPDVRDGLTRAERTILWCLAECEKERPGRSVPVAMLYGRVVEHVDLSVPEFQAILQRLVGDCGHDGGRPPKPLGPAG
jgi:hypothetical protein